MTDVYDAEKRSAVMARVKGRDTAPEKTLRRLLTQLGARYRLHRKDLPGSPDIVLPGRRLVVFAHGCFWHGHDCARGSRVPKANRDYWLAKVGRNRARDAAAREALEAAGWRVETVWECEMKDEAALKARLKALLASALLRQGSGQPRSAGRSTTKDTKATKTPRG
ncbi:DNA mismatch endonuclease Vsr [Phenylobacterium sp.]|uniref:very short patch repair endonuclease n=1 Tax=Phenylobacterium sp. TaxID=1871053 RepID=UPI0019C13DFC|nr:DNA mismatch endonuclease Vsr [Phenylobacterium sp.]MBC7167095.1 DNA mismatch endonuclease Vsr [Phenylobacterium sp.]